MTALGRVSETNRRTSTTARMPIGTLMNSDQRHEREAGQGATEDQPDRGAAEDTALNSASRGCGRSSGAPR